MRAAKKYDNPAETLPVLKVLLVARLPVS